MSSHKNRQATVQHWAATAAHLMTNRPFNEIHALYNRRQRGRKHRSSVEKSKTHRVKTKQLEKKHKKKQIRVGTWNTRRLGAVHARQDPHLKLKNMSILWEKRHWDAALLTEVKLGASGQIEFKSDKQKWTIIYRGRVAFALSEKLAKTWWNGGGKVHLESGGIQNRGMIIDLPTSKTKGVSFMSIYIPTSTTDDEEITETYATLSKMLDKKPTKYTLIGGGDFNAEVGNSTMSNTTAMGPHGPPKQNDRGKMLMNWCEEEGLAITNTWTPQNSKTTGHTLGSGPPT